MPDKPVILYVATDDAFRSVVKHACKVWSDILAGHVTLLPWEPGRVVNVTVLLSSAIDTFKHPGRVAECARVAPDLWQIRLLRGIKWAISPWQRFWRLGENAQAAVLHEMGHIFQMPHASNPNWIMHADIGGAGKLSPEEKESYRQFFVQRSAADTGD